MPEPSPKAPIFGRLRQVVGKRSEEGAEGRNALRPPPRRWERHRIRIQEGKRRGREGDAREEEQT